MTRLILMCIFLFTSNGAWASFPQPATLEDLACKADHIFTARVVEVDMVDGRGNLVTYTDAMTGPGLKNTIRLKLEVVKMHVSDNPRTPKSIKVPLDNFLHYSLGQIREAHSDKEEEFLVFLQGKNYHPVIEGRFLWNLGDLEKALSIHRECDYWE